MPPEWIYSCFTDGWPNYFVSNCTCSSVPGDKGDIDFFQTCFFRWMIVVTYEFIDSCHPFTYLQKRSNVQWASRKKGYHTIFNSYRRLGTVGIFTYYENNLGRILNNITSHGSIKQNRCQPWWEWPEPILHEYWFTRACKTPNRL